MWFFCHAIVKVSVPCSYQLFLNVCLTFNHRLWFTKNGSKTKAKEMHFKWLILFSGLIAPWGGLKPTFRDYLLVPSSIWNRLFGTTCWYHLQFETDFSGLPMATSSIWNRLFGIPIGHIFNLKPTFRDYLLVTFSIWNRRFGTTYWSHIRE